MRRYIDGLRTLPSYLQQRILLWGLLFGVTLLSHAGDLVLGGSGAGNGWLLTVVLLDAAVLLLVGARRRVGVVLGVATMLGDAAVSWWVGPEVRAADFTPLGPTALTVFAVFVVVTSPGLWSALRPAAEAEAEPAPSPSNR